MDKNIKPQTRMGNYENWEDDFNENEPHQDCPKCNRSYDDIDYDYQCCSKCGWDVEKKEYGKKREPTNDDYLSGEADVLTGRFT